MLQSLIKGMKVRTKLIVVFILPFATLIALSLTEIERMREHANNTRAARDLIGASLDISHLIDELQKERGLSAGFVGSQGKEFRANLLDQRRLTDQAIVSLEVISKSLPQGESFSAMRSNWQRIYDSLARRTEIMRKVDRLEDDGVYWAHYSEVIADLIGLGRRIPGLSDNAEIGRRIDVYTTLLWLEERAAQERGLMSHTIAGGLFGPETYRRVSGRIAQQEALVDDYRLIATPKEWKELSKALRSPEALKINQLRESITYRLAKSEQLSRLQSHIGYGGLIHDFKNYVLRGKVKYRDAFMVGMTEALQVLKDYRSLPGMSDQELEAVAAIEEVLGQYRLQLDTVLQMRMQGKTPAEIDKIVTVDDGPALIAVETLRAHISPTDARQWFALSSARIEKIAAVREHFKSESMAYIGRMTQEANAILVLFSMASVLIISTILIFGGLITTRVSKGISQISQTLRKVSVKGDYGETVPLDGSDEIGVMAQQINSHLGALNEMFDVVAALLEGAAAGEFIELKGINRPGDLGKILQGVEASTHKIEQAMEEQALAAEKLSKARIDAEAANQAKSEFLSSMSHELRTPLNAVLGFAQLLELDEDDLNPEHMAYIQEIQRAGQHLLDLINQVLSLAKIETGNLIVDVSPIDLKSVIDDCLGMSRGMADRSGIRIENITTLDDDIRVLGDKVSLTQVLMNLISNAVKYSPGSDQVAIKIVEKGHESVRINVIDKGLGISQEKQAHLFTPFDRLGREAKGIEGTGIGLSITKTLVEKMNGVLGFKSELGVGSTFWVELKIAQPDETSGTRSERSDNSDAKPSKRHHSGIEGRLLYIEDNEANLTLMERLLRTHTNIEILSAGSAEEGLALAEQEMPDIVLMDINLPGMNGDEALLRLKENDATKDIPVVAISANAMPADVKAFRKLGFHEYLTKPFEIREVLRVFAALLKNDARKSA